MNLLDYFERNTGTGVLATADPEGNVNGALYSRPHIVDETTLAFIMNDRLTHANIIRNPRAAYIFIPNVSRRDGIRLYITMTGEVEDPDLVKRLRRKAHGEDYEGAGKRRFVVYFRLDRVLPLIGSGE